MVEEREVKNLQAKCTESSGVKTTIESNTKMFSLTLFLLLHYVYIIYVIV
jgi:hypothetical protein